MLGTFDVKLLGLAQKRQLDKQIGLLLWPVQRFTEQNFSAVLFIEPHGYGPITTTGMIRKRWPSISTAWLARPSISASACPLLTTLAFAREASGASSMIAK